MGTGSSINAMVAIADHTTLCDNCDSGLEAMTCSECGSGKFVCRRCCKHTDNDLFNVYCVADTSETIPVTQSVIKGVRRGMYLNDHEFLVLTEEELESGQFQWKLHCLCTRKTISPGIITKPMDSTDRKVKFPGDMCMSKSRRTAFITIPCTKFVYSFLKHNEFFREFKTKGQPYGIACFDNGLAVSVKVDTNVRMDSPWQLQYLTYNGEVKTRVYHGVDGKPLFGEPLFLATNAAENLLFVSDREKNAVLSLNPIGELVFLYMDLSMISKPLGLDVDDEENVYVACGDKVVQIKASGDESRELLYADGNKSIKDVHMDKVNRTLITVDKTGTVEWFSLNTRPVTRQRN